MPITKKAAKSQFKFNCTEQTQMEVDAIKHAVKDYKDIQFDVDEDLETALMKSVKKARSTLAGLGIDVPPIAKSTRTQNPNLVKPSAQSTDTGA